MASLGKSAKLLCKKMLIIYVIQECENPTFYRKEFEDISYTCEWFGENKNKGLAIFAKKNISIKNNNWPSYCLRNFVSLNINNKYNLVAIWACYPYIEEYYIYQSINIDKYDKNTIIIGDFNSNAIWDKQHGKRNHSIVVSELKKINLVSAYHFYSKEEMGKETQPTFYLYRYLDKPYHIDYCFLNPQQIRNFDVLKANEWLKFSDHLPIKVEIE